jgi:hypothetical protein
MTFSGFSPNCQTTAMGIMAHTDIERALEVALSLDIPFSKKIREKYGLTMNNEP